MKLRFRPLCLVAAVLSLSGCDKPAPPATATPAAAETENQLAEAHDALQRQALEIETKTALMDKQLAEMRQSLKDRENAELQSKLEALNKQNEELRAQADAARRESDAIAERIAVTPTPNAPPLSEAQPDYSMFYEGLAPYGSWLEVNGYGYCWQPTIGIAGWRPYLDGCWVWSSFGWAWQTNEPFGWATYHYGRWVNLSGYGWVWVPGSEWAPAWVAWRQSSDCVGWAPLPPEQGICSGVYRDCDSRYGLGPASYVFINTNVFVSRSYLSLCAPVAQQNRIFQCSVNVTQIVPRSGHRHAFVQQGGPSRSQMEQVCGISVPQRPVQTLPAGQMPAHWRPHERTEATAPVAMVELPAIAPGARVMRPEIKEHIQRPARVSESVSVPQHVATEIREQGNANAAAEHARMRVAAEQDQAAALQQRQQQEMQERLLAEKRATEQAAVVQQQEALAAQQQRMAAEQTAATENERTRRQAEVLAMQQQQEETTRRSAEEQLRIKHETERRTQEIAQRQAEEHTRAQHETERRSQEMAQRQAEEHTRAQHEAAQRTQEMAKRQAEESARRQQETETQRAHELTRRTAEEQQMRAQHEAERQAQEMARRQAEEAGRRAQEHAQRQAEEQAHRAQEEARRTAAEATHRAAGEASRNPSHPGRP